MPQTSRSKSIISLLLIAVMSGLMTFDFPSGDEPTTVVTVAMSDAQHEDSLSSSKGDAGNGEPAEMSNAHLWQLHAAEDRCAKPVHQPVLLVGLLILVTTYRRWLHIPHQRFRLDLEPVTKGLNRYFPDSFWTGTVPVR